MPLRSIKNLEFDSVLPNQPVADELPPYEIPRDSRAGAIDRAAAALAKRFLKAGQSPRGAHQVTFRKS